ncbi:MAG: PAS domain-containing protein, partial [Gammaproteobacteria bacterium]|nr:PAS domain-containing protein [Gammaproteobacteria bacterium]
MKGWRKQLQESGILFAGLLILAGVTVMAAIPFISNPALLYFLAILAGLAATIGGILLIVHIRRARRAVSTLAEPLQNEERLRLALEGAGLGIFDWNIVTGEQIVNQEWLAMLGYSPSEIHTDYDDWKSLVHPADLPAALRATERHFEGLAPIYEAEYRLKTKAGEWKWVLARGRVVARGPGGEPLRMSGTHRDITERKEVGDALTRRDAVLGAISATAERLLTSTSWLEVLPELLAGLGQAIQASRAYVFEIYEPEPSDPYARKLCEWTAVGIIPELISGKGQGKSIRGDGYGRWLDVLSSGQILQGKVSTFPASELPNLINLQVQSLIEVPIFTNGHWWGFIGFDDCTSERRWLPAEEDALKVAANVLAAAIQRQQLYEAESEERRVAQAMLEMATVFSRSLNYDSILDRLLEQVPRIVPFDGAS